MKIAIEEIMTMLERRAEINNTPLDQIEWTLNGVVQQIAPDEIDEWDFTGLGNIYFAENRFIRPCVTAIYMSKEE
jgi:hypothetical protein